MHIRYYYVTELSLIMNYNGFEPGLADVHGGYVV